MNLKIFLHGVIFTFLWNAGTVHSVLLTSTLITGLMGGYLIGRTPLGTFLGALTNNASLPSLPSLPAVSSFIPSLPTFSPRQEKTTPIPVANVTARIFAPSSTTTTTTTTAYPFHRYTYPTYYNYPYQYPVQTPAPVYPQPYPYSYSGNGIYSYNLFTSTTNPPPPPTPSANNLDLSLIEPVDVPVSLDNKIRERFIRQLGLIDPLNCLPKTFCEVTSDPYRAAIALDKGTILGMSSIHQPIITRDELMEYEARMKPPPRPKPSTTTAPPTTTTTTSSPAQENDEEDGDDSHSASEEDEEREPEPDHDHEQDDVDSGSHSEENSEEEEEEDSFELYRKEHEHKLQMQALDEMIDDIEDPETYAYILRDKQKMKNARKKFREKYNRKKNGMGQFHPRREDGARIGSLDDVIEPDYPYEDPPMNLARRAGSDPEFTIPQLIPPPMPPLPPPAPPVPPKPSFFRWRTTEAPVKDMFADDPFFDDMRGRSARNLKGTTSSVKKGKKDKKRLKRDLVGDPLTQYRLAYIVAEKYKNPNLCNAAFPSCPYQTQTIMSVVNRLQSGLLPMGKTQVNRYREKHNRNNLEQFRNTLIAIERLNKATMNARARGEPIDIEEVTEVAANPSTNFETNESQNIINDFQKVVAKIQSAQLMKRKLQLEKAKPLNSDRPRTNYDAVHYYKKAQMDALKPKEKSNRGISRQTKASVRQQDDEAGLSEKIPTFKETYREMFRKATKKVNKKRGNESKVTTTTSKPTRHPNKAKNSKNKKGKRKYSEPEDDERDAKKDEEAIDAMIIKRKRHMRF